MSQQKVKRIYVDSGVFILASKAKDSPEADRALEELDRDDVEFVFSNICKLESIPQIVRNSEKFGHQLEIIETYFSSFERVPCDDKSQDISVQESSSKQKNPTGLGHCDSLHIGCAIASECDEIVTTEFPTSQMCQNKSIAFRTI